MFNVDQTVTDLEATIEHMRETDWIQGRNFNRWGACCAWGAMIYVTSGGDVNAVDSIDRTSDMGRVFYRVVGSDVVNYNDEDGRSKSDVIQTLERVLSALKADPSILTGKRKTDA